MRVFRRWSHAIPRIVSCSVLGGNSITLQPSARLSNFVKCCQVVCEGDCGINSITGGRGGTPWPAACRNLAPPNVVIIRHPTPTKFVGKNRPKIRDSRPVSRSLVALANRRLQPLGHLTAESQSNLRCC